MHTGEAIERPADCIILSAIDGFVQRARANGDEIVQPGATRRTTSLPGYW